MAVITTRLPKIGERVAMVGFTASATEFPRQPMAAQIAGDQLPFDLRAHEPVGNAAAIQSGGVVHRLVGFAIENRTRRLVAQRLVQPLLVIKAQPAADALPRLRNRAIG